MWQKKDLMNTPKKDNKIFSATFLSTFDYFELSCHYIFEFTYLFIYPFFLLDNVLMFTKYKIGYSFLYSHLSMKTTGE